MTTDSPQPSKELLARAHRLDNDDRERAKLIRRASDLREASPVSRRQAAQDLNDAGLWRIP